MKRKIVNFTWDDEDAQAAFAEWCPFPNIPSIFRVNIPGTGVNIPGTGYLFM